MIWDFLCVTKPALKVQKSYTSTVEGVRKFFSSLFPLWKWESPVKLVILMGRNKSKEKNMGKNQSPGNG